MSVPQFDPWSDAKRPPTRAYRAYCAYLEPTLGTSGTIGTGAESFSREYQPGQVRAWERKLWAGRLKCNAAGAIAARHDKLLISSIEFCRGPWAARLASLGWRECDVFAAVDDPGDASGLIQTLNGQQIRFATSDTVYFGNPLSAFTRTRLCVGRVAESMQPPAPQETT